jgi:hypothetical protein
MTHGRPRTRATAVMVPGGKGGAPGPPSNAATRHIESKRRRLPAKPHPATRPAPDRMPFRERGQAALTWLRLTRLEKLQREKASRTSLKFPQSLPILEPRKEKPFIAHCPCPHACESRGVFCAERVEVWPESGISGPQRHHPRI